MALARFENMNTGSILEYNFLKSLAELPFVDQIILFGSRARGDNQDRSDIDLAIVCPQASDNDWLHVVDIIENADSLLKIDCVRFDKIDNQSLIKKNILIEGKILYAKNSDKIR